MNPNLIKILGGITFIVGAFILVMVVIMMIDIFDDINNVAQDYLIIFIILLIGVSIVGYVLVTFGSINKLQEQKKARKYWNNEGNNI